MLARPLGYKLRDYQQNIIDRVYEQWGKGNNRIMIQLPTGGGKTVIFSEITRQFTVQRKRILIIAHREELVLQARDKLLAATGQFVGIIKAGYAENLFLPVQIASLQTLARRENLPDADLIIYDEAHHSCSPTASRILEHYSANSAHILGFTATPCRIDGQGFKFLYDALIEGATVEQLIEDGHLCGFKLFACPDALKRAVDALPFERRSGDDLAAALNTSLVMGDIIKSWRKHAEGLQTIVFAINVAHSQAIAAAYREAGVAAEHLDGDTPAGERQAILDRFRNGQTKILTNCGIVSEGFDVPAIGCVQCVRPTRSLSLWFQMLGRAMRPHPGKQHAVIIDHTENWAIHGLPYGARGWSLEPVSLRNSEWAQVCPCCQHVFQPFPPEREAGQAICPNCKEIVHLHSSDNAKQGAEPSERHLTEDLNAPIDEINLVPRPEAIRDLHRWSKTRDSKKYKPGWLVYTFLSKYPTPRYQELQELAKLAGYKPGWAMFKWKELREDIAS